MDTDIWISRNATKKGTEPLVVPTAKVPKMLIETPDEGGRLGKVIVNNLIRLVEHAEKPSMNSSGDIFSGPQVTLNSRNVPDGVGGTHSIGTGEFTQGKPHFDLPPSVTGTIYIRPKELREVSEKTVRLIMDLDNAAVFLHEVNHAIHRFVNGGQYMQPNSSRILGAVSQDIHRGIMGRTFDPTEKKANEMETYWLSCCDAIEYNLSNDAVMAIKAVNNQNLLVAGYEMVKDQNQFNKLLERKDDKKLWSRLYDINTLSPTEVSPPSDDIFEDEV